ncbi:MAG: hypothetical protein GY703_19345 [Gammaproteobacteria bacterium]|nr:hypothetical protein [Gammaproteobacteria bacterium]
MSDSKSVTTELVIAGFDDAFTAYLASAALARLKVELEMATNDIAAVIRKADGKIAVQQTINRDAGRNESSTPWERQPTSSLLLNHQQAWLPRPRRGRVLQSASIRLP